MADGVKTVVRIRLPLLDILCYIPVSIREAGHSIDTTMYLAMLINFLLSYFDVFAMG